jgi:hypothetical protein
MTERRENFLIAISQSRFRPAMINPLIFTHRLREMESENYFCLTREGGAQIEREEPASETHWANNFSQV